jgi:hypothetical protein
MIKKNEDTRTNTVDLNVLLFLYKFHCVSYQYEKYILERNNNLNLGWSLIRTSRNIYKFMLSYP